MLAVIYAPQNLLILDVTKISNCPGFTIFHTYLDFFLL